MEILINLATLLILIIIFIIGIRFILVIILFAVKIKGAIEDKLYWHKIEKESSNQKNKKSDS